MRAAPAHLESKLRFWDLSVGQIAAAFAGIMLGVAWAKFLSPLHGMWGAMSGAYIAALPVFPCSSPARPSSTSAACSSARSDGGGSRAATCPAPARARSGYLLSDEHADSGPGGEAEVLELELQALWDDPPADTSADRVRWSPRATATPPTTPTSTPAAARG